MCIPLQLKILIDFVFCSHPEYEDKHMHYRDGAPPPQPRTRHRAPPPSDYPGEMEGEGTRRGTSSSASSSQPPPISSRKTTRDLPEGIYIRSFTHTCTHTHTHTHTKIRSQK